MRIERRVMLVTSLDVETLNRASQFLAMISLSKMIPSTQGNVIRADWDSIELASMMVEVDRLRARVVRQFGEGPK